MTVKWQELCGSPYALGALSAGQALGDLGWRKPTLFVGPGQVGTGHHVASALDMNLMVDEDLDYTAWYVEFNGRRVGSVGA